MGWIKCEDQALTGTDCLIFFTNLWKRNVKGSCYQSLLYLTFSKVFAFPPSLCKNDADFQVWPQEEKWEGSLTLVFRQDCFLTQFWQDFLFFHPAKILFLLKLHFCFQKSYPYHTMICTYPRNKVFLFSTPENSRSVWIHRNIPHLA